MPSPDSGNEVNDRQRSAEAVELRRAFQHGYSAAKRWLAARLLGTVLVAAAAPVVITFAPGLERPLGAIAGAWVLAARLLLRPAQERATRFAAAVQEMFDQYVLGIPAVAVSRPPTYEQIHQQARRGKRSCDTGWYSVRPSVGPAAAVLIAQRSGAVWSRRLHGEWTVVIAALAGGWTVFTVVVAAVQGATVTSFLVAVLLPMLPALLDAVDLCQAHWRAAAERSELESALDEHLDETARGQLIAPGTLRALQDEITRQRLTQPTVPDWYYRLRRISYENSMRAAADRLAQRLEAAGGQP